MGGIWRDVPPWLFFNILTFCNRNMRLANILCDINIRCPHVIRTFLFVFDGGDRDSLKNHDVLSIIDKNLVKLARSFLFVSWQYT